MSFVKLSIFGTSFEVRVLPPFIIPLTSLLQVTTRYVDLQPVGMGQSSPRHLSHILTLFASQGAFGLVWCVFFMSHAADLTIPPAPRKISSQAPLWR